MPRAKGRVVPSPTPDRPVEVRAAANGTPAKAKDPYTTPAMQQYARFKREHPACLLLFRMGDFYECFGDDAREAGRLLGLTVTERSKGLPMAGVPHQRLDTYLARLVRLGVRVAVCEQVQDPKDAKGVVERAVTQVVTPGTLVDDGLLDDSASNHLAAAVPAGDGVGLAIVELSTGSFCVTRCAIADLADELARRQVHELVMPDAEERGPEPAGMLSAIADAARLVGAATSPRAHWEFRTRETGEALREQFGVATLEGFGLSEDDAETRAAGAVVRYLRETQSLDIEVPTQDAPPGTLHHLQPPRREARDDGLLLDAVSLRALEIERTLRASEREAALEGVGDGSVLGVFTGTRGAFQTPMGKRLLRDRLCRPAGNLDEIERRLDAVERLAEGDAAASMGEALAGVGDVARIAGRLALARATPRDLVALGRSLAQGPSLRDAARTVGLAEFADSFEALEPVIGPLAAEITDRCVESPPPHLREGGLIRDGVDAELDECRTLQRDAGVWLAAYQERLSGEHDLPGLKVGFNKVFGYYIELPRGQAERAPDTFIRKQTLKNAERYLTPELKEFEDRALSAESRAIERERTLFFEMSRRAAAEMEALARFGSLAAEVDASRALAVVARNRGWTRPLMTESPVLAIESGRHPVLEGMLGDRFVANGLALGGEASPLALVTGPNMAGKSTFIRQTALIVILAHAGSFVPASHAVVGRCDRVFTRVGADDALHRGQSTFMVEMTETANILHHATPRSLVVLDEIGRGTSTLDGLSLAWAITEHLARGETPDDTQADAGPRTLFATHYHELTELEQQMPGRVSNLHVMVREVGDDIAFLHRIREGRADQSYGVHVARLAGVPESVVARARAVLRSMSVDYGSARPSNVAPATPSTPDEPMLFDTGAPPVPAPLDAATAALLAELGDVQLDRMTPLDAFDLVRRWKATTDDRDTTR